MTRAQATDALAAALEQLGAAGRNALYLRLGDDVVQALATALAERAPARPPIDARRLKKAAFREAWQQLWKQWDALIARTNREGEDGYLRNAISYTAPDLDQEGLSDDLDDLAKRLAPLVLRAADEDLVARFDLGRKLAASVSRIAEEVATYVIASEEGTQLGPEVTTLVLEWYWRRSRARGDGRAAAFARAVRTLRERLGRTGLGAMLDEGRIESFVRRLPAAERARIKDAGLEPELD